MTRVEKLVPLWRVNIVEYERGWGSNVIDSYYFFNEKKAREYLNSHNKHLDNRDRAAGVPDYYIVAQGPFEVSR